MADLRAWDRACAVGAVEEAEALGSAVVGTEHLLLATLAEPTVRWALRTVGVDRPRLQAEVERIDAPRRQRYDDLITADASDAIIHASSLSDALDVDDPGRDEVARVLRLLIHRFLSRGRTSEARDILDRLGVLSARAQVLTTIEHNARPATAPPARGPTAQRDAATPERRRVLRLLGRQPSPGPSAG